MSKAILSRFWLQDHVLESLRRARCEQIALDMILEKDRDTKTPLDMILEKHNPFGHNSGMFRR